MIKFVFLRVNSSVGFCGTEGKDADEEVNGRLVRTRADTVNGTRVLTFSLRLRSIEREIPTDAFTFIPAACRATARTQKSMTD